MRFALFLPVLVGVLLSGPASSDPGDPPRRIAGPVEAHVLEIRDGDTVTVAAHVWPMQAVHVAVRLRGVDAPERRGDCRSEIEAAERAHARLSELLAAGSVRLRRIEGDKYWGRVLADIETADEPDVARRLLLEGLVEPYDGGRRRDWCALALGPAAGAEGRGGS